MKRILGGTLAVVIGLGACAKAKEPVLEVATTVAGYRNITVTAEATGKVEPINIVDIKSKAGGQIIEMPVETGTRVRRGDVIVKLDPRDVQSRFDQAQANYESAEARLNNARLNKERNDKLFAEGVLTAREHETSALDLKNAETSLLSSKAALDLAQQQLDDATILAPSDGIILEKIVSEGTVIASASGSASGGTTLVRMADLSEVRAKVLVTETDIGKVTQGLTAQVLVDAYPGRVFEGRVEKVEPIAVVEQNVTMFPVLVRLPNEDGALKPGMNGEIGILVDSKQNVLAVHPDAIRTQQVAAQIAPQFGLTAEQVNEAVRTQRANGGIEFAPNDESASQAVGGQGRQNAGQSRGDSNARGGQNGRQGGGGAQGGRGQQIQVTDAQCQQVTSTLASKPELQAQIDAARAKMQDPSADRQAIMAEIQKIYADAGLDNQVVSACNRRSMGSQPGRGGGRGGRGGGRGGRGGGMGGGGAAGNGGAAGQLGQREGGASGRMLPTEGVVYVQVGTDSTGKATFEPRWVRMGIQDFDSVEILAGLRPNERVAMLAQAVLQNQRDQARARQQQQQSVIPGTNTAPRGGGGGNRGGGGGRGGRGGML